MMDLKHQADARRKMRSALRRAARHLPPPCPALLFLTDPVRTPDPLSTIAHLPSRSGVILRHFGAPDLRDLAWPMARACARFHHIFLIAGDPELAHLVGADGVHWPEARLGETARWRGSFVIQTASAHSRRAIWRAKQAGLDAALVSAVFPSRSPTARAPLGPVRLRNLSRSAGLPLYALGGITSHTAGRVADHTGLASVDGVQDTFQWVRD